MTRHPFPLFPLLAAAALLATVVTPVAAQTDPAALLKQFLAAVNRNDVPAQLALLTEDVIFVSGPCQAPEVLALSPTAVDDRNLVSFGEAADSTTETTGHAHQMGVVQLLVGPIHQAPPPGPKAASRVAQAVVGVQDDAIDTVIAPIQEIPVPLRQLVGHTARVNRSAPQGHWFWAAPQNQGRHLQEME